MDPFFIDCIVYSEESKDIVMIRWSIYREKVLTYPRFIYIRLSKVERVESEVTLVQRYVLPYSIGFREIDN